MGLKNWVRGAAIVVSGYIAGNEIQTLANMTPQDNSQPDIENATVKSSNIESKDTTIALDDAMQISPDSTPTPSQGTKGMER